MQDPAACVTVLEAAADLDDVAAGAADPAATGCASGGRRRRRRCRAYTKFRTPLRGRKDVRATVS